MIAINRFRILKGVVHQRRRVYMTATQYYKGVEEAVVHALCWTDPYALVSVNNYPSATVYRLMSELFFDHQARLCSHASFDTVSFLLVVIIMKVKLNMLKQK